MVIVEIKPINETKTADRLCVNEMVVVRNMVGIVTDVKFTDDTTDMVEVKIMFVSKGESLGTAEAFTQGQRVARKHEYTVLGVVTK